ncbi:D-alanyl-D-alanine carboxypeptidase [Tuanshanicoccus lijuaniae]|uniref:D-alanyl-D-alanine carboxypeptidase family protein n=1 Tax=Aerococcaceae bacterium zg-1292 TaxID=2774330 RepID=UPI001935398F|nr:D-alanyl-D-alanine carboxypeptidase [Aerococcaceae bacterium zg-1292]
MNVKKQLIMFISLIILAVIMPVVSAQTDENVSLEAMSALLVDAENGQILFEKEADLAVNSGAATKLLLVYLVYEAIAAGKLTLDAPVPISDAVYQLSQNYEIANIPLRQDFQYTVEELLQAVAVKSANGAALALVEATSSSQQDFLGKMKQKLTEWHLEGNQLTNILGISTDDNGSQNTSTGNKLTAKTIATIAYRLINDFPEYLEYTKIERLHFKAETSDALVVENSNDLLDSSMKPDGLMLTNAEDGYHHQILTVRRNNRRLLAVVLGEPDEAVRTYKGVKQLMDYGFTAFNKQNVLIKDTLTNQIPAVDVVGGKKKVVSTVYTEDVSLTLPSEWSNIKYLYEFVPDKKHINEKNQIEAPIKKNTTIGTVKVSLERAEIPFLPTAKGTAVPIKTSESVEKAGWIRRALQGAQHIGEGIVDGTRKFFIDLFN